MIRVEELRHELYALSNTYLKRRLAQVEDNYGRRLKALEDRAAEKAARKAFEQELRRA